jgi:tricorn protease-like protein
MIRRTLLIVVIACSLVGPGVSQTRRPRYVELFDVVWQTINDNFYDPAFGGVDWKAIRQKYLPEVAGVFEVKWTLQDFCEQRDPDLAKALELFSP